MTQIKRINADLIRENLPNPRHLCAIKNVAVLYNSIFQRSRLNNSAKLKLKIYYNYSNLVLDDNIFSDNPFMNFFYSILPRLSTDAECRAQAIRKNKFKVCNSFPFLLRRLLKTIFLFNRTLKNAD